MPTVKDRLKCLSFSVSTNPRKGQIVNTPTPKYDSLSRAFLSASRIISDVEGMPEVSRIRLSFDRLVIYSVSEYEYDRNARKAEDLKNLRTVLRWVKGYGTLRKEKGHSGIEFHLPLHAQLTVVVKPPYGSPLCEQVQVGTEVRTVERPANPNTEMVTVTEEVPVYEWVCPDVVMG